MRRILNILNNSLTAIHPLIKNNLFIFIFLISFISVSLLFYLILGNLDLHKLNVIFWFTIGYFIIVYKEIKKDKDINIMENIWFNLFIIIFILLLCILVILYFNPLFWLPITTVYCLGDDMPIQENNSNDKKVVTKKIDMAGNNEDNYNFSLSKDFVQDSIGTIINSVSDTAPRVVGCLAAGKAAVAMIKTTPQLPPLQRALLAGAASGGVALSATLGVAAGSRISKSVFDSQSQENKSIIKKSSTGEDIINPDINKSSIIDINFDDLSTLEALINYEILFNLLILFHFIIILLTLFNMYYSNKLRNGSFNLISKWISKENSTNLNNFLNQTGKYTNKYLLILIVINILTILFCVFCNLFINISLSNHLDHFIEEHQKWNKK